MESDRREARRAEIVEYVGAASAYYSDLIENVLELEERISYLRTLPFIMVKCSNPAIQKATPAAKMYKELLQQYINAVKALERVVPTKETGEASPLEDFIQQEAEYGR